MWMGQIDSIPSKISGAAQDAVERQKQKVGFWESPRLFLISK